MWAKILLVAIMALAIIGEASSEASPGESRHGNPRRDEQTQVRVSQGSHNQRRGEHQFRQGEGANNDWNNGVSVKTNTKSGHSGLLSQGDIDEKRVRRNPKKFVKIYKIDDLISSRRGGKSKDTQRWYNPENYDSDSAPNDEEEGHGGRRSNRNNRDNSQDDDEPANYYSLSSSSAAASSSRSSGSSSSALVSISNDDSAAETSKPESSSLDSENSSSGKSSSFSSSSSNSSSAAETETASDEDSEESNEDDSVPQTNNNNVQTIKFDNKWISDLIKNAEKWIGDKFSLSPKWKGLLEDLLPLIPVTFVALVGKIASLVNTWPKLLKSITEKWTELMKNPKYRDVVAAAAAVAITLGCIINTYFSFLWKWVPDWIVKLIPFAKIAKSIYNYLPIAKIGENLNKYK